MPLNKQKDQYRNKEWLYLKYWDEGRSLHEIARISGACYVTIWTWMKRLGISRRNHSQAYRPREPNRVRLTLPSINFIQGLLLGDGCLTMPVRSTCAYYSHADKHLSYIQWLSSEFDKMGIRQSGQIHKMKAKNHAYRYKSLRYVELRDLAHTWYDSGQKIIPEGLTLTPTILLNWYIGDGNFSRAPIIDSSIFSMQSLRRMASQIADVGIALSLHEFKDRKRIRISKRSEKKFFEYILSERDTVPECYFYKFPHGVLTCR